jgi:hypothetical protein
VLIESDHVVATVGETTLRLDLYRGARAEPGPPTNALISSASRPGPASVIADPSSRSSRPSASGLPGETGDPPGVLPGTKVRHGVGRFCGPASYEGSRHDSVELHSGAADFDDALTLVSTTSGTDMNGGALTGPAPSTAPSY